MHTQDKEFTMYVLRIWVAVIAGTLAFLWTLGTLSPARLEVSQGDIPALVLTKVLYFLVSFIAGVSAWYVIMARDSSELTPRLAGILVLVTLYAALSVFNPDAFSDTFALGRLQGFAATECVPPTAQAKASGYVSLESTFTRCR